MFAIRTCFRDEFSKEIYLNSLVYKSEGSSSKFVFVDEQAFMRLAKSKTPKTGLSATCIILPHFYPRFIMLSALKAFSGYNLRLGCELYKRHVQLLT